MIDPVHRRAFLVCLGVALTMPAGAADLPHLRARARPETGARSTAVVVPAVPLAPTASLGLVLATRQDACHPGFMADADDSCRRAGVLLVACDPNGGPCRPLPPTPIPYGVGPYLRPDY